MEIGTRVEEILQKAIMLDDSVAWIETHTEELKEYLLDLIRYVQLNKSGVDSNENVIGYYSKATEIITNGRKQAGEKFTLKDTGDFYRSMFISVLNDSILIDADYDKMINQDWWRIDILGLTNENLEEYAQMVKQNYIKHARKVLELD